jgi:hypothetical protein
MTLLQKFLLAAVSLGVASGAWAADFQQLLTDGQTAFMRGDMAAAKRSFLQANKMAPNNPTVIGFLKQIETAEKKNPGTVSTEGEYKGIIIPKIEFKEATFGAALDFMKKKVTELTGGKKSVNFVLQISPEQQNTPVSLTLSDIPFTEALRYIAEMNNAKVEYQKFAVVIKPAGGDAGTSEAKLSPKAPAPQ